MTISKPPAAPMRRERAPLDDRSMVLFERALALTALGAAVLLAVVR